VEVGGSSAAEVQPTAEDQLSSFCCAVSVRRRIVGPHCLAPR
jgi:hypothetical protein